MPAFKLANSCAKNGLYEVAFKVDQVHARMFAAGARETSVPRTLGTTAWISMALDPDGNWIELPQHASIVRSFT